MMQGCSLEEERGGWSDLCLITFRGLKPTSFFSSDTVSVFEVFRVIRVIESFDNS